MLAQGSNASAFPQSTRQIWKKGYQSTQTQVKIQSVAQRDKHGPRLTGRSMENCWPEGAVVVQLGQLSTAVTCWSQVLGGLTGTGIQKSYPLLKQDHPGFVSGGSLGAGGGGRCNC